METGSSREFQAGVLHPGIVRACNAVSTERLRNTVSAISYPRHIVHDARANLRRRAGNWILKAFEEIGLELAPPRAMSEHFWQDCRYFRFSGSYYRSAF